MFIFDVNKLWNGLIDNLDSESLLISPQQLVPKHCVVPDYLKDFETNRQTPSEFFCRSEDKLDDVLDYCKRIAHGTLPTTYLMATSARNVQYKEKSMASAHNNPLPRPPRESIWEYNAYANESNLTVEEWNMK